MPCIDDNGNDEKGNPSQLAPTQPAPIANPSEKRAPTGQPTNYAYEPNGQAIVGVVGGWKMNNGDVVYGMAERMNGGVDADGSVGRARRVGPLLPVLFFHSSDFSIFCYIFCSAILPSIV